MADLPNESISWLQNGEPVTGGSGGNSDGVLNRPLVQFLANDNFLQSRIDIVADDDGFVKKLLSTVKIADSDTGVTARVQFDSTGIRSYDGTNQTLDINATKYGLELGHCTVNQYGPLRIVNAGVTGAANLHTTYPNAELDTIAVDDAHEMFIKNGSSTWAKIGGVIDTPISSVNITTALVQDNSVILDKDGLTMRKAAGAVRFDVNEDGSFTLGHPTAARLAFTTGDAMTLADSSITGSTLTTCTIDADNNTISNLAHGSEVDNPSSGVHGVTGSIVGTTDIQTLEEKRLRDTNTYFDGLTNRKVRFSCANVTAGDLKTVTFLDASGTMVLEDATQTLTNKSISGGQINSGTVAAARIDVLDASKITTGTFDTARIPDLSSTYSVVSHVHAGEDITTGTVAAARIADLSSYYSVVSHNHDGSYAAISHSHAASQVTSGTFGGTNYHFGTNLYLDIDAASASDGRLMYSSGGLGLVIGYSTTWHKVVTQATYLDFDLNLEANGSLIRFNGHDSSPAFIELSGSSNDTQLFCNAAGTSAYIVPRDNDETNLYIGSTVGPVCFADIDLNGRGTIELAAGNNATGYGYSQVNCNSSDTGNIRFLAEDSSDVSAIYWMTPTAVYPDTPDAKDLGGVGHEWEDFYVHQTPTVGDFYFMDYREVKGKKVEFSDLAAIEAIKSSNKVDKRSGLYLIDDDTIPEFLKFKNKKTGKVQYNKEGKPYLDLKTMISLNMGGLREVHSKVNSNMETVLERFNQLEARLAALESN